MAEVKPPEFVDIPFTVEPNYAGWRLDRYLCHKIQRLSRNKAQLIIKNSLIADRPLKPSTLVKPGLHFKLRRRTLEEPETPTTLTELYLDDHILVVDKPAGLPMHPTARYHRGTLVTLLKVRYGEDFRADPAHRLDRETSGIIVCGRTLEACQRLMRSFMGGEVHKEYLAVVEGAPPEDEFEVDAPIAEGTDAVRIAVRIDRVVGKPSRTRFRVLQRFERDGEPFALVRAYPMTGRQHQIRIHLREAGYPIVGDKMYGPDMGYFDRFSRKCLEPEAWVRLRLPRQALHAAALRLPHPHTGQEMRFEAPLPEDLQAFLDGRRVLPDPAGTKDPVGVSPTV
ncbi:MAG: RluA family pseudouridine synthase [Myxococcaceae bacterium]|nr:RluA family pseudouridine synthase [Myxococcaceae bacterium]